MLHFTSDMHSLGLCIYLAGICIQHMYMLYNISSNLCSNICKTHLSMYYAIPEHADTYIYPCTLDSSEIHLYARYAVYQTCINNSELLSNNTTKEEEINELINN